MAYSGHDIKGIMRVMVTDSTISPIEDVNSSANIREGFILCKELVTGDVSKIQNQNIPKNIAALTWRVLVPHDLVSQGSQVAQPSPAYKNGDILYVARLGAPVVIANSSGLLPNIHPSLDGQLGIVQLIPHKPSMAGHYSMSETSMSPANDCVFWVDLNVDGRTRGGGSGGGGGSVSVVWL
jgi:hypothetical protein